MKAKYLVLPAALFALSIVAHGDGFGNTFGFGVAFSVNPEAFNGEERQPQHPRRVENHKSGVRIQESGVRADPAGTPEPCL